MHRKLTSRKYTVGLSVRAGPLPHPFECGSISSGALPFFIDGLNFRPVFEQWNLNDQVMVYISEVTVRGPLTTTFQKKDSFGVVTVTS